MTTSAEQPLPCPVRTLAKLPDWAILLMVSSTVTVPNRFDDIQTRIGLFFGLSLLTAVVGAYRVTCRQTACRRNAGQVVAAGATSFALDKLLIAVGGLLGPLMVGVGALELWRATTIGERNEAVVDLAAAASFFIAVIVALVILRSGKQRHAIQVAEEGIVIEDAMFLSWAEIEEARWEQRNATNLYVRARSKPRRRRNAYSVALRSAKESDRRRIMDAIQHRLNQPTSAGQRAAPLHIRRNKVAKPIAGTAQTQSEPKSRLH